MRQLRRNIELTCLNGGRQVAFAVDAGSQQAPRQRMPSYEMLPEQPISGAGPMTSAFLARGIRSYRAAGAYVHGLPYGYNSDPDDPMILFKEGKGTCTPKHAVIASLAAELGLPVTKRMGIYAMTEAL